MAFSSFQFLFLFLPIFLALYICIKKSLQNGFLFIASLIFYYFGGEKFLWILIVSIALNFYFAILIEKYQTKKIFLSIGVGLNLGLLVYFKYAGFLTQNLALFLPVKVIKVALPIGISFFTFQGISYLVDVYRGEVKASKSFITIGTYISSFPQLIAGPIVRYKEIAEEIETERRISKEDFANGIVLFCIGLIKKVIIADTFAGIADEVFSIPKGEASFFSVWIGMFCYTLQIYFDFSAYSDMARGLGRMLGFTFPINFNYPYIATSVKEFWQRWHITLSHFFRDYLYIPLGGNRVSNSRLYFNLLIVFLATGVWHGASWNFIIWGLWHGLFLLLERYFSRFKFSVPKFVKHIYLLLVIIVGWVFFRAETLSDALFNLQLMFLPVNFDFSIIYEPFHYLNVLVLIFGVIFSMPIYPKLKEKLPSYIFGITIALGMIISTVLIITGSYSPFLYFRF
jgi:alginate O-acetyltransferase complex protein AlgI